MIQDITIEELLSYKESKGLVTIDVRSPSEYADATFPGSLNIPLFDDAERAEIGTLYKQVSIQAAKERGLEIVSAKLPAFIKSFQGIEGRKAVFCWRGGMRSKTTATLLSLMGIQAYRLNGGIRAYRKWVVETLEGMQLDCPSYVITGNTGTGKTAVLRKLLEEGYPVLDFEGMAGHRGSIFGEIGLKANNQKTFESLLVHRLLELKSAPYILMEGESKRVGRSVLPQFVVDNKEAGTQLCIRMPLRERVCNIINDYMPGEHHDEIMNAYARIKSRIHTPIAKEIEQTLQAGQYEYAVEQLLVHYYDPRYEHAMGQYGRDVIELQVNSVEEAVEAVKHVLSGNRAASVR